MAFFKGDVYSYALDKMTPLAVYLPQDDHRRFGVQAAPQKTLILLHGLEGNYSYWSRYTSAERYAQRHNLALVMPDADMSMYADMRCGQAYARYIGEELPQLIDRLFRLNTARAHLSIAGLSMGGYGALKAALTYPERFGRCASFSGALMLGSREHLRELAAWQDPGRTADYDEAYEIQRSMVQGCLGAFGEQLAYDPVNDLLALAEQALQSGRELPRLLLTCGTEDFLYPVNQSYSTRLRELGLRPDFGCWPGVHDWQFWEECIRDYMGFFSEE